jgi:hypothetical protein
MRSLFLAGAFLLFVLSFGLLLVDSLLSIWAVGAAIFLLSAVRLSDEAGARNV